MSVCISVGAGRECTWWARSWLFDWFVDLIGERFSSDTQLVSTTRVAGYHGGVPLEVILQKDKDLAMRMRDAFLTVATEIADGRHKMSGGSDESHAEYQKSFAELASMLKKCELGTKSQNKAL